MKKIKFIRYLSVALFSGFSIFLISSCTQSPTNPNESGEDVTFRTIIDNSAELTSSGNSNHNSVVPGVAVDSIQITGAGFFVSAMRFFSNTTGDETDINRTEIILRDDQFILDFEGYGKQYIGDKVIYPSTYRSIRFTMSPSYGNADSLSRVFGLAYNNFFRSADGNTISIRGNIWKNGISSPFEYHSMLSGTELAVFDSAFTVSPDGLPKEIDIALRTSVAFKGGQGILLDPRDSKNAAMIDANLRSSLHLEDASESH